MMSGNINNNIGMHNKKSYHNNNSLNKRIKKYDILFIIFQNFKYNFK